ncbi:polyprenyl synthetase family protein [Arcanobacterium hippocoleae]
MKAFERLCIGQLRETAGVQDGADPIAHYLDVLSGKTGSLIALSAWHGVTAAGGSQEDARDLAEYGERVGVAFQLADDVIDLISDSALTGKTPGTDLLENVATMPTLLLRKHQQEGTLDQDGKNILELLDSGEISAADNLNLVLDQLRSHAVVAETKQLAAQWADDALSYLARLPEGAVKDAFSGFAHAMVQRMA